MVQVKHEIYTDKYSVLDTKEAVLCDLVFFGYQVAYITFGIRSEATYIKIKYLQLSTTVCLWWRITLQVTCFNHLRSN